MVRKIKIRKKKKKKSKSKHPSGGNCYEANGRWFLANGGTQGLVICHGEVVGQGRLKDVPHGHCWIEDSTGKGLVTVHDYSAVHVEGGLHVPAYKYYAVGQIGENVIRYDHESFLQKINEHKTWGPFDFESSTGL